MALPTRTPVVSLHRPDKPGERTVRELDEGLRGAEVRAVPRELRPLDDAPDDLLDDDPDLQADGRGVVVPLVPVPVDPAGDWKDAALCAETDPEAFFPEKGGSTREAKKVCTSCEVRVECLDFALANDERFGIWGGLSERERRRLKKQVG